MKKFYCVIYGKYRKFKNPELSFIFRKALFFSIICSKCETENEKIFKEGESIEILKIYGLFKIYNCFKTMVEESISQEFRLKNIDETRNYFLEEIEQNELMSRKHRKVCKTLNYIEHFLVLASAILDVFKFMLLLLCLVFL